MLFFLLDAREGKMGKGRMQAEGCREQEWRVEMLPSGRRCGPCWLRARGAKDEPVTRGPAKKPGKRPILDGETEGKNAAGIATANFGDGVPVRSRSQARLGLVKLAQPKDVSFAVDWCHAT